MDEDGSKILRKVDKSMPIEIKELIVKGTVDGEK